MQNKKTANIFFRVDFLVLEENFAPMFAVIILGGATNKITIKFAYPKERGGKPSILLPEIP